MTSFRKMFCFAIATLDDGREIICHDGGRPSWRRVPMLGRKPSKDYIEGSPVCATFEDFEAWVTATYGG